MIRGETFIATFPAPAADTTIWDAFISSFAVIFNVPALTVELSILAWLSSSMLLTITFTLPAAVPAPFPATTIWLLSFLFNAKIFMVFATLISESLEIRANVLLSSLVTRTVAPTAAVPDAPIWPAIIFLTE